MKEKTTICPYCKKTIGHERTVWQRGNLIGIICASIIFLGSSLINAPGMGEILLVVITNYIIFALVGAGLVSIWRIKYGKILLITVFLLLEIGMMTLAIQRPGIKDGKTEAMVTSNTPIPTPTQTINSAPSSTPWPMVSVGVVQVHSLNYRSGPDISSPIIGSAKRGDEMYILEHATNSENEKWFLVLLDRNSFAWVIGEPYYVSEKLVSVSYMTYKTTVRVADKANEYYDEESPGTSSNNSPVIPTRTSQPVNIPQPPTMLCSNTQDSVGSEVSCTIPQAYCSYQSGIFSKPTFCTDALSPNHNFTLVKWGSDWSDYNGKCIIVTGLVSEYKDKPQIEATDRSQVSSCP
ncbi:MAG: SH3 domain-containing protein [Chloroflexi bacterium]|nr:SH3 domain-containing protein [Chloroflexota bacterium]